MEFDLLTQLADNLLVIIVLGYWVYSERRQHREDTQYYRETIKTTLEDCKAILQELTTSE